MIFFQIRPVIKITIVMTLLLASALAFAEDKKTPGDKVAEVNGVVINKSDFERALELNKKRLAARGRSINEEQMDMFKNEVLESIIEMELLYQESKKKGIQVDSEAFSKQFETFKKQFPNDAEFEKWLQQNNFTASEFKDEFKRLLAVRQLMNMVIIQKVKVTDEETKSYYDTNLQRFQQPEKVKASHILIKVDAKAAEDKKVEAREKIEAVQQKVQKGEDFADLAKTYSEGPSGPRGGDLGYFSRGQMVKPFEEAAFNLKPNEVSDIVETRFGYHLIKVFDKMPAKQLPYAEVKDKINEGLKRQKIDSETMTYIKNLKKDAKIEKFL